MTAPLDLVTTAVLELLRGAGRPVYDGAYTGDPARPPFWYSILYRLTGGSSDPLPDLDDSYDEVTAPYQVTAVADRRNQAEAASRILRDRLLTGPLVMPDGWACIRVRPDDATPGVDRSGTEPNAIFTVPARYLITVARA